jgi:phosphatidylserine/phosphatidylglycerophosphate/cardiolipin synthase-like enzyme
MNKAFFKFYFFIILLLLSFGCQENDDMPVQEEIIPSPVKPLSITLPEAIFTEPARIKDGMKSTVIYDRVTELVDATPEDASIYISIYQFYDFKYLVDALKRAFSRNVKVHIMVDMSSHDAGLISKNKVTVDALKALGDDVEIVLVDNDAGSIAINHNKFILFSQLSTDGGTLENVVFQTSHNFTRAGLSKIQDAVILSHEGLYQAYFDYWLDMKSLAPSGMKNFDYREYQDPAAGITAFFHPKRKDGAVYGEDTIIEILNDITDPSSATIKIGMSVWSDSRVIIVEKLDELLTQGAKVEVIAKSSIGQTIYDGLKALEQKGAFVKIYNMTDGNQRKINIHTKLMMIEGNWRGEETNLLLTGSQNFSNNALKNNNETSLLFKNHEFFETYNVYYEELKTLPGICCP